MKQLKKNLMDIDKPLLFTSLFLLIFGLLNIVTASSREAVNFDVSIYHYFVEHSKMIFVGLIGFFIIISLPTKFYQKSIFPIYTVILLLTLLTFWSGGHRGASIWLNLGPIRVQPGEFSKPIMIVALSILFERIIHKKIKNSSDYVEFLPIIGFLAFGLPLVLFLQKDLGNAIIMITVNMIIFMLSPVPKIIKQKIIQLLFVFGVIGAMGMFFLKGYILSPAQMSRLNFVNPCERYETSGYQICNAYIAINDGGLFGQGIGKSKQKYSYIAEPHTDMVFSIITEEYGAITVLPIFLLYAVLLSRLSKISYHAHTIRGRYIALGVMALIFTQVFVNLGGLLGLIPLTGVTLPFLSYGGSFTITLLASLGLACRVSIENKNKKIRIS